VKAAAKIRLDEKFASLAATPYSSDNVIIVGDVYNVAQGHVKVSNARYHGRALDEAEAAAVERDRLRAELQLLEEVLETRYGKTEDAAEIAEAIKDLQSEDAPAAEGRLARVSRQAWETAREIGAEVAGAAIARALGL
jgi:hypothetical protein